MNWLTVRRGTAPLVIAFPHTGTDLPEGDFHSDWLARRDADWWVDRLYAFATELGATTVHSAVSRSVIDLNRDPSGQSLYPGQVTTGLVPLTTFDGEALGPSPDEAAIAGRLERWFLPYHAALRSELDRLRGLHGRVVLYDAHSIRSHVPMLFAGELPVFNIGTDGGRTCAPELEQAAAAICTGSGHPSVVNGRFRGGWTTRHYGQPQQGVHAIQMELAMRGYMAEPDGPPTPENWPTPYDPEYARPIQQVLEQILRAAIAFAGDEN